MPRLFILALTVAFVATGCDAWLGRFDKVTVEIDPRAEEGTGVPDGRGSDADGGDADADGGDVDGAGESDDAEGGDGTDAGDDDSDADEDAPVIAALTDVDANAQFSKTATITDDSTFTVEWTMTAGPGVVNFGSPTNATTTIDATVDGDYTIQIKATDAHGFSSSETFELTWDTVEPDNLLAFTGSNGTTVATVDLEWDIPAGATGADDIDRLVVRRSAGAIPADCTAGDVAAVFVAPFTAGTVNYTDDTDGAGATFGYRICITDAAGNERSDASETVNGLTARKHYIFVTAQTYDASFGGTADADAICQAAGTGSSLNFINVENRWRAVLSTSTLDAVDHVSMMGIAKASDDTTDVATSNVNFWGGSLVVGVFSDEEGLPGPTEAWTGTTDGGISSGSTCGDWTATAGNGTVGDTSSDTDEWFEKVGLRACNNAATAGIYCISQYDVQPFDAFDANTSAVAGGRIDLEFDMPSSMLGYDQLVIRRAAGGTAPASCSAGTAVTTISDPNHGTVTHRDTVTAGDTYSYRVCVLDGLGNVVLEDTATGTASN